MTDPLPPMTLTEAVLALDTAVKPWRALLDMERILQAALAAESDAIHHADNIKARQDEKAKLDGEIAAANAALAAVVAQTKEVEAAARAKADAIVAAAGVKATSILDGAEKALTAAKGDAAKAGQERDAVLAQLDTLRGDLDKLTRAIDAAQGTLAAAEQTIAKAEAIKRAMG